MPRSRRSSFPDALVVEGREGALTDPDSCRDGGTGFVMCGLGVEAVLVDQVAENRTPIDALDTVRGWRGGALVRSGA